MGKGLSQKNTVTIISSWFIFFSCFQENMVQTLMKICRDREAHRVLCVQCWYNEFFHHFDCVFFSALYGKLSWYFAFYFRNRTANIIVKQLYCVFIYIKFCQSKFISLHIKLYTPFSLWPNFFLMIIMVRLSYAIKCYVGII